MESTSRIFAHRSFNNVNSLIWFLSSKVRKERKRKKSVKHCNNFSLLCYIYFLLFMHFPFTKISRCGLHDTVTPSFSLKLFFSFFPISWTLFDAQEESKNENTIKRIYLFILHLLFADKLH